MRSTISEIFKSIFPYDNHEREHLKEALDWLDSGAQMFRLFKPNIPDIHLVAYCVLIDVAQKQILLVDHKKCNLWLPPGGHVDPDEHPRETAKREMHEELGIRPELLFTHPVFMTVNETSGGQPGKHTDVSLWYVFSGNIHEKLDFDPHEFNKISWFKFDEIPIGECEPHLHRFLDKLIKVI